MKNETRKKIEKYGKHIYIRESQRGWVIAIRPDNIFIDNHDKDAHLHIKLKGIHIPIKYKNLEEVGLIVELHLIKNKGINKEKLKGELL
nr:hypothetical protein [Methanobrevibacter arboriphilus]